MQSAARRTALLAAVLPALCAAPVTAQRAPRVASVQIMPSDATVKVGDQAPFVATALDADGNPIVDVTFRWISSNSAVASIDQEGIATAHSPGKAIITVRVGTGRSAKSAQAPLDVTGTAIPAAPVAAAPAAAAPAAPTSPAPTRAAPAAATTAAPTSAAPAAATQAAPTGAVPTAVTRAVTPAAPSSPAAAAPAAPTRVTPTPPAAAQASASGPVSAPPRQPPAEMTTLRYAPGSLRYRIQGTAREVRVDASGASRTLDGSLTVLLSAALAPRGDSLVGIFTIDSVAAAGSAWIAEAFAAARGRTFRAVFTSAGRPLSLGSPDSTNDSLVAVSRVVIEFLTLLPPSPFAVGYAWTDTVPVVSRWMGGTISNQSRRRHTVVGWDNRDGERALRVVVTETSDQTGRSGRGTWGDPVDLRGSERDCRTRTWRPQASCWAVRRARTESSR